MKCPICKETRNNVEAKKCIDDSGMCPACVNQQKYGYRQVGKGRYSNEM